MPIPIARGLTLPDDFVTARVQLLGMSGAGKSNAFAVMVEGVYDIGAPFVWFDPYGAAWGMRSSADGNGPGLNVPIFGGYHGDMPLHPTSGALIARELYQLDASAVLDLSALSPIEVSNFVADYADELFALHLKRKKIRAVFVDEGSQLAPQTSPTDAAFRSVQALQRLHTGGRGIGIGLKIATQSSADQSKATMKQAEMIVALRTFSPLDQKPVLDYLRTSVDKAKADEIKRTLSTLKDGEAWFVAPRWLGEIKRARFPMRRTFDSSSTPKVGEIAREPRVLAPVEIARLRKAIEMNAKTPATDALDAAGAPELRAKIARLTAALEDAEARAAAAEALAAQTREIPVVSPADVAAMTAAIDALRSLSSSVSAAIVDAAGKALSEAVERSGLTAATETLAMTLERAQGLGSREYAPRGSGDFDNWQGNGDRARRGRDVRPPADRARATTPAAPTATGNAAALRAGARRMIEVLARCGGTLTKAQLATLADVNRKSGTFSDYVRVLAQHGYIEDGGSSVHLLKSGADAIGVSIRSAPPTTEEILAWYTPKLRAGARRMLELLVRHYPREMKKETLAAEANVNRNSGTFSDYVRVLDRNGLIEGTSKNSRTLRANPTLFLNQKP